MKDIIITLFAGIAAGVMFSIPLFLLMLFGYGLDVYSKTRNEDKIPTENQQKINSLKTDSKSQKVR